MDHAFKSGDNIEWLLKTDNYARTISDFFNILHIFCGSNVFRQCSLCVSFIADWLQSSPEGGGLSLITHILMMREYITFAR